ncbi:MAG: hypothetical protein Pars2KO_20590 [Parasphingorhabdus sp.]
MSLALLAVAGSVNAVLAENGKKAEWAKQATQSDVVRIEQWRKSLEAGVKEAIRTGHGREISKRAPLFADSVGKRDLALPDGKYHCSITKLGGSEGGGLPYIAYPKFRCMVTRVGKRLQFTKLTGSQMTSGWIYMPNRTTGIYLGTSYYGYEDRAPKYGSDEKRDDAAIVERIGEHRWRMIFPDPYYESVVDVMELTPIG